MAPMSPLSRRAAALAGSLVLAGALVSCTGGGSGGTSGASDSAGASDGGAGTQQTLTVFAAASLTDVENEINQGFVAEHPGVQIRVTPAGSNDLVTQIAQGAPADVLATADTKSMDSAVSQELIEGEPTMFATNELVIAVQPGNPKNITSLADLAQPGLTVVRCAPEVPCGGVSDQVLGATGVTLTPASEENSVTDVLTKVTSGEADAGLVYATDVKRSDGESDAVTIPEAAQFRNQYPIAVVKGSPSADLAQEYVDYVTSEKGQKTLQDAGFGTP
ncbi:molybdate ABC transporter substrate-binding protein [Brachybacterium huguangmaarense]